jgi:uncharacterized protein YidB (DUF937 family)
MLGGLLGVGGSAESGLQPAQGFSKTPGTPGCAIVGRYRRNEEIAPEALEKAIGGDTLNKLIEQSGLSRNELLEGLSAHLPNFVDKLTPEGRLPTEQEVARL